MFRSLALIVVAVVTLAGLIAMAPMSYALAIYREWHWAG